MGAGDTSIVTRVPMSVCGASMPRECEGDGNAGVGAGVGVSIWVAYVFQVLCLEQTTC